MKASLRLAVLLFVCSVFLTVDSVGLSQPDPPVPVQQNPYHIPSDKFEIRFKNEYGQIQVLPEFDKLSQHLQFLQYYRIVKYSTTGGTAVLPHHSDAEYLLIVTKGSALTTVLFGPTLDNATFVTLNQFDALRIPAGAVNYAINVGGASGDEELEYIKLALPKNFPGQFEDLYPTGQEAPTSYYTAFSQKTLQAAFNASYDEIENVLWGPDQWRDEVIVKLPPDELRSVIRRAQSRSEGEVPAKKLLGPIRLRRLNPCYSNPHGQFREALPLEDYPFLEHLNISASYLKLDQGSLFLPHYNTKAIILAFVVNGEGQAEIGSPYPLNNEQQQEEAEEEEEGYIQPLAANVSRSDLYIIPADHPVAVSASRYSGLEVVEFILSARNNSRMFLTGVDDDVVKNINPLYLSREPEKVKELLDRQKESFFVNREQQPISGGDKSPRQANRAAWSIV